LRSNDIRWQTLLSTPTSFGRVRGFTVHLLRILADGPQRLVGLQERTGKQRQYIYTYLKNMLKYGLVSKDGFFWQLTEGGVFFLSLVNFEDIVITNSNNNNNNNKYKCLKKEERKKKEGLKKEESSAQKQVKISLWISKSSLDRVEGEVVELLVKHYNETGSKFVLMKDEYEMAEKLQANVGDIHTALRNLRQDNRIYLRRSEIEGYWKLGIKVAFLESLKKESECS
jgi:predicted transcriptional regulator